MATPPVNVSEAIQVRKFCTLSLSLFRARAKSVEVE